MKVATRRPPAPPRDAALPALPTAFDEDAMCEVFTSALADFRDGEYELVGCRPAYVRYKRGTNCLVLYELAVRGPEGDSVVPAHAKVFSDGTDARRWQKGSLQLLAARVRHSAPFGRVAHVPELGALLQTYPIDGALPGLALADAGSLPEWLRSHARPELVRYKPARKALLRCERAPRPAAYAKLYRDDRARALFEATRALADAGVPTPAPLGYDGSLGLLAHEHAPGDRLDRLHTRAILDRLPAVAEAIALLHAADPLPCLAESDEGVALRRAGHAVAALRADLAPRVGRLVGKLCAAVNETAAKSVPVHGDFSPDQVLVWGGGVTLLDFDGLRLGPRLLDVGNFLAHIALDLGENADEARASFLEGYPTVGHDVLPFEAAGLLRLAVSPFRRLDDDWPEAVEARFGLAERRYEQAQRRRARPRSSDGALPQLNALLHRRGVARELERCVFDAAVDVEHVEVVRHKPGRRCTVRYDLALGPRGDPRRIRVYGKTYASDRGPRVHETLTRLAAAGACGPRVVLPEPLGYIAPLKLLVQREVPGHPAAAALCAGDRALAARIALALDALHRSAVMLPRRHRPGDELDGLRIRVPGLGQSFPRLATPAGRCLRSIESAVSAGGSWRYAPVHRDLYHDQVLVANGDLGILDFDDAAMSEPALDVANFVAHLRLLAVEHADARRELAEVAASFVDAYSRLDPALDHGLVHVLESATLLRLACIHAPRAGERLGQALLERAEKTLRRDREAPW